MGAILDLILPIVVVDAIFTLLVTAALVSPHVGPRRTVAAFMVVLVCTGVALGAILVGVGAEMQDGQFPDRPVESPSPWPSPGPSCASMAHLGGRWVCIPEQEAE